MHGRRALVDSEEAKHYPTIEDQGEPTDAFKTDMRTWGKVDTQLSRLSCQPGLRHDASRLSSRYEVRRCLSKEEPQERRCNCQADLEP